MEKKQKKSNSSFTLVQGGCQIVTAVLFEVLGTNTAFFG
jgi:hypothetical protein